jgi:hypothetical protein
MNRPFSNKMRISKKMHDIVKLLKENVVEADAFVQTLSIRRLKSNKMPKPKTFSYNSLPAPIREQIGIYVIQYSIPNMNIYFITNNQINAMEERKYNEYAHWMFVWLRIASQTTNKCVKKLDVFVYHTDAMKVLPNNTAQALSQEHVNTAFTRNCGSEIVIFRKEEWFKVFLHETFHTFSLDFSAMNTSVCKNRILTIFPVQSQVNLEESYSECWARIINAVFCSYFYPTHSVFYFLEMEQMHAAYQVVKVLNHMGLLYKDLYNKKSGKKRQLFQENTNVLSYYIITFILLQHVDDLLVWCFERNENVFCFKKSSHQLNEYCDFIESKYKSKRVQDAIHWAEWKWEEWKWEESRWEEREFSSFLKKNLRMAVGELL